MLHAYFNGVHVLGNFNKLTKRRPKGWMQNGYKIIVPYKFKWREKIGSVECDCKECEEHFAPYYGVEWYHVKECALMKYIDKKPQILNLWQYAGKDMRLIAFVE
jgi:hypothetical protein